MDLLDKGNYHIYINKRKR